MTKTNKADHHDDGDADLPLEIIFELFRDKGTRLFAIILAIGVILYFVAKNNPPQSAVQPRRAPTATEAMPTRQSESTPPFPSASKTSSNDGSNEQQLYSGESKALDDAESALSNTMPPARQSESSNDNVREPVLLYSVKPIYPQRALEAGREGDVVIEFTISSDGYAKDAIVKSAKPKGWGFERSAMKALAQWRYRPRLVNGQAVNAPGRRIDILFRLEEKGR